MFGAAVSDIPLSLSQRSQRNGDAVNAEVGASQTGVIPSAPLSRNVSPMS